MHAHAAPRFPFHSSIAMLLAALALLACASAGVQRPGAVALDIPAIAAGPKRPITTRDLALLRDIDTLSVSPRGDVYAIQVRQADVEANAHRIGWFVGPVTGGALVYVGDGGDARLRTAPRGLRTGDIAGSPVRWSPDGRWIAYTKLKDGEVQVWAAKTDGGGERQVTRAAGDVRDFAWSQDGQRLYFSAGPDRAVLQARNESGYRNGFHLDDYQYVAELVHPGVPDRPVAAELTTWVVDADGGDAHAATAEEQAAFAKAKSLNFSWGRSKPESTSIDIGGAAAPPIVAPNGALAWLSRAGAPEKAFLPYLRLTASMNADGSEPITCTADVCRGQFFGKVWWNADGSRVIFWRNEDANLVEVAFYSWDPRSGDVRRLFRHDGDFFSECALAGDRLVCAREMVDRPDHVVAIDVKSGELSVLADVNPEFRDIELGRVERFEWTTPPDRAGIGYGKRVFGYVIYPRDFDPKHRYPAFIAPYGMPGFRRGDVGDEHPLFVYAEHGIVVLSTQFPLAVESWAKGSGADVEKTYSVKHDFPHLTMYAGSTFRALDTAAARGFIDETRVGIGGVSHGSFVPLFMVQKADRIAAIANGGPGWSQYEYFGATRTGRALSPPGAAWPQASADFWSRIDIAEHVEKVEAPLLVNYADREFFHDLRLPRTMENAGRAYEAHIYPEEHHVKWQPAHRYSIYNRNLDWFRFWLQDVEDADPAKADQYARWRKLRELQCKNPRSVRDYCKP